MSGNHARQPKEKQLNFIQRLYPFGSSQQNHQKQVNESPKSKKTKHSFGDDSSDENYSVQRLKQFWNNRIITSQSQTAIILKQKSATLGTNRKSPEPSSFIRRNSLRSSSSRKSVVRSKLIPLYSENNTKSENKVCENKNNKSEKCDDLKSETHKRTSLELSPRRDQPERIKKYRPESLPNINFPLVSTTPSGGNIHWAKRAEVLSIRAIDTNEDRSETTKMPLKIENYVNNFIDVDIQEKRDDEKLLSPIQNDDHPDTPTKVQNRDSLGSRGSLISARSLHHTTPVRKVSFKTNLTPYNRKLLHGNGNKVAALTNRFNKLIQQDSAILEEVKKRGGYVRKAGGHVYKIKEDDADIQIVKKKSMTRKSDDSSDEVSIKSGKNSYRKPSIKRRTSIKKHNFRKHENEIERSSICVKDALQFFELNDQKTEEASEKAMKLKPKVPDKSEEVIKKTKELRNKKIQKKSIAIYDSDSDNSENKLVPNNSIENEVKLDQIPEVVEAKSDNLGEKSTCRKIYEKFIFRSSKILNLSTDNIPVIQITEAPETEELLDFEVPVPKDLISEKLPVCIDDCDSKIVDALRSVNQKIDNLSKSFSELNITVKEPEELSQNVQPNVSFLFRSTSKNSTNETYSQSNLVEAVNNILINKSVSMDDTNFPCPRDLSQLIIDEIVGLRTKSNSENEYEIVAKTNTSSEEKIDDMSSKIESFVHKSREDTDNIYQSLLQVKDTSKEDTISVNSYESFENYESVDSLQTISVQNAEKHDLESEYEICDPPEPPPPRNSECLSSQNDLTLPMPKRNLSGSPKIPPKLEHYQSNYEKIKYDKIPPRPPKFNAEDQNTVPLPPRNTIFEGLVVTEHDYEENIYDTIKSAENTCYESIQKRHKQVDTLSLVSSNCYESIGSKTDFPRLHAIRHAESITTLSSDHNTNSLYGTAGVQSITPPSERGSDASNSDDWIDISDEEEETKHNFVVIRERNKMHHRTPLWSRKVRDQLLNQQKIDDDTDHHYESLYSVGQDKSKTQRSSLNASKQHKRNNSALSHHKSTIDDGLPTNEDEFDSFASDIESDDEFKKKSDSGVDISNAKLPDPPTPNGQVYAFMQKIKNFGTLSKSEITKGFIKIAKKKSVSTKSLKSNEDSPVAEETNVYENTPTKPTRNRFKTLKLPLKISNKSTDPYENTEFHKPITPTSPNSTSSPKLDQSEKSLASNSDSSNVSSTRKKSKSGKSFKSKLRKSLNTESSLNLGSSFNGTRSTFYISDSVDVDSGIFNGNDNNCTSSNVNLTAPNTIEKDDKLKTPDSGRRKSASPTNRPSNPPPPPPSSTTDKKFLKQKRIGTTSWYAECGVFKSESLKNSLETDSKKERSSSSTSWYAEAGLYQTSGASVASSSESSGVSTGGEGGPGDDNSHSMFLNEPLYQIYNAAKLESLTRDIEAEISGQDNYDDGYEKIGGKTESNAEEKRPMRPTALELIEPNQGPSRTLWCEIPEVINSEILSTLTRTEKCLQEAKFEILTSEASYLKSLNLLKSHFMNHPAFRDIQILSSSDRKTLFSFIIPIQECSDRLLCDLENCWQDNIMLLGLSQSIYKHAEKHFYVYINYCEHQAKIERTLRRLKDTKPTFFQTLEILEFDPLCCSLSLSSFLMLPMQRITRMRLLIDAVLSRLKMDDDEFESWERTFILINQILSKCNEAADRCEQMHKMEVISRQIEFPTNIRPLAIVPCGVNSPGSMMRKLEKKGELTHLIWRGDDAKLTFGKKFAKCSIYAFLFTDLFVLTKKKSDESYLVIDHCPRALLTVTSGDIIPQLPTKEMSAVGKHLIIITLLENYEGKTVEMILACPSETERQRWLKVTEPLTSNNPDEKLYEQWDCPQVIAKHSYQALQPDELSLDLGDVVNISRKMGDGWYEGERIRDGVQGWFPGNYTDEIATPHIRAKHIKQRHILLTYTAKHITNKR